MPVAILITALTFLAGCTSATGSDTTPGGPAAVEPSAEPAVASDTTGAIAGLVVDDSLLPIAGALVGIQDQTLTATTDVGGSFTFNALPPGRYVVLANALGYQAASKAADVAAGEVVNARLVLSPLPTAVPFPETLQFNGLIECGWGISGAGTGNCLPIQFLLQQTGTQNPTNTEIIGLFLHSDAPSIVQGVFEMAWDPSAATTAAELSLLVELEQTGAIGGDQYGSASGPSPLRVVTDNEPWTALTGEPINDQVQTRTFPAARTPPTFVVNQRFTVYATACHFAECGELFTTLADA
ncbi:MAG TPA: carboxypeptidase-like regulatory domain-containing protein [Candidatus Thermoplasmatota archaeon]